MRLARAVTAAGLLLAILPARPAVAAEPLSGLLAWGANGWGQLGIGSTGSTTGAYPSPTKVLNLASASALGGGERHSLAVDETGRVWAWGDNGLGQLGNGGGTGSSVPVAIEYRQINAGGRKVVAVDGGGSFSLALRDDGTVWAWGQNNVGQLGDGTNLNAPVPIQVPDLTSVTAIAAGGAHALAVRSDGTVWAWGYNDFGQLGDGTRANRAARVQVKGLTDVVAVDAGEAHSMGLRSGGTVRAWGGNVSGQLGDGTTKNRDVPTPVAALTNVTAVVAGRVHALALRAGGDVWAWGQNYYGQVGDGTEANRLLPVRVQRISSIASVAAGGYHSLALQSDGALWAWGYNFYGQLGPGQPPSMPAPVRVADVPPATVVSADAGNHNFAYVPPLAITAPGERAYVSTDSVTIRGTGPRATQIRLRKGTTTVGTTTTDSSGAWAIPLSSLAEGEHMVRASSLAPDGTVLATTPPRTFVVDTTAPNVEITHPAGGLYQGNKQVVPGAAVALTMGRITVRADASDGGSLIRQFRFLVDGVPVDATQVVRSDLDTYEFEYEPQDDEIHDVAARALNGAGIERSASIRVRRVIPG